MKIIDKDKKLKEIKKKRSKLQQEKEQLQKAIKVLDLELTKAEGRNKS